MKFHSVRSAPGIHLVAGAGTVAGLSVASFRKINPQEVAAAWSLLTIIVSLVTSYLQKPRHVALTSGVISAAIGNLAILNVHVTPGQLGMVLAGLSYFTGSVVHMSRQVTPETVNVTANHLNIHQAPAPPSAPAPGNLTVTLDNPGPMFPAS